MRYEDDKLDYFLRVPKGRCANCDSKKVIKYHTYTVDFILKSGIRIETKGRFIPKDRTKHLAVKRQYPDLDIRFVFTNPRAKLYKGAKTTYGEWCDKYGFKYSKETIPEAWFNE